MATILDSLSLDMTSIIMGDFNDDLMFRSSPSMLQTFMSSHEYYQLVDNVTTYNSTIRDHVYCNRPCECQRVSVVDAYSDHDMVQLSLFNTIPMLAIQKRPV